MGLSVVSTALAATAAAHMLPLTSAYMATGLFEDVKNCLDPLCPDLDEKTLHRRVAKAFEDFSYYNASYFQRYVTGYKKNQEYLRFKSLSLDPREKTLFVSAEHEENGALDPQYIAQAVNEFEKISDVKYTVSSSPEKFFNEIKEGADAGKLTRILLHAFGDSNGIAICDRKQISCWLLETSDIAKYFAPLDPHGRIVLLTPLAGAAVDGDPTNNIAQKIANLAKREVIAPTETIYSSHVTVSLGNHLEIYHPSRLGGNIFKLFRPAYNDCEKVFQSNLHPKEIKAIEVIGKNLLKKSLIYDPSDFEITKNFVRFCKDDPKQKLLVFYSDHDPNGVFDPAVLEDLYGTLADHFDFKFKVVSTHQQIGEEINNPYANGNPMYIVLSWHGEEKGFCYAGDCSDTKDWIHVTNVGQWGPSFMGGNPKAKIFSLGCNGANSDKIPQQETIAAVVSEVSKKTMVASKEEVYPGYIEIISKDELKLYHPSEKYYFFKKITFQKPDNTFIEIRK